MLIYLLSSLVGTDRNVPERKILKANERKSEQAQILPHAPTLPENAVYNE